MIYLDLETYSTTPINRGTLNYAADAEIMLVGYALDDAPEKIWDVETGAPIPTDLYEALKLGDMVCAHNSFFDRNVMLRTEDFSGIDLRVERWYDTMVQALAHGLPGGLDKLSEIFGLDKDTAKDKRGRALIKLFCIPQKDGKRVRRTERPAESAEFNEYLRRDIRAMRAVHKLLPKTNFPVDPAHVERQAWFFDQHINDRGFAIDLELAEAAVETAKRMKTIHAGAADDLTLGAVSSTTKVEELRLFLNSTYHLGMHDMTASTVNRRLEDPELPAGARELLALRAESSKTSATKYATLLRLADSRGRVGGTLQFCGAARTGRSAGRGFQPHNLPRPAYGLKERHIEQGIEDIKAGVIEVMSDKPMEMLASCVRGAIVAPPGKRLDSSDLSNIEGRGLVYLSGEDWKLNYFRDFDSGVVPFDNYVMAYAKAMGVKPETVTKSDRQVGKVMELACGFQSGVNGILTFAKVYNLNMSEFARQTEKAANSTLWAETLRKYDWAVKNGYDAGLPKFEWAACEYTKMSWRASHPKTVQFWRDCEDAFKNAVSVPNCWFDAGPKVRVIRRGQWLYAKLPSGRALVYLQPKVIDGECSYMGMNQYSRKWERIKTYAGKLAENLTQAFARDILFSSIPNAEAKGYAIVLSVHDELVAEVPDTDKHAHEELSAIMSTPPVWAEDMPISAAGFSTYRYRKED